MRDIVFHLIPNAHLDPVWLWDWREGLNEGLTTCRTILDLMDEDQQLTFIRGETAIYEHIERTDPPTFARIRNYVKSGRWDPVGGTVIQPDTNLPDAETLAKHFTHGQRYLLSRFGRISRVAWAADSFGHSAGLPQILRACGIEYFAFTRPSQEILPIDGPAFWWEGPGGARVLAYRPPVGWYGAERDEMPRRLDELLAAADKGRLTNVACFFGLGNHGGGPTRRHLHDIRAWAETHPRVKLIFSGLHRFFDALRREVSRGPKDLLPVHRGELNFVLRGCYSSVAKFKFAYRRTENILQRAERAQALTGMNGSSSRSKRRGGGAVASLYSAWHGLLFNSFHDILPGSSIERAFDDQLAWIGGCYHAAQQAEFAALNALARQIDTRVRPPADDMPAGVPMLLWNPHPRAYRGPVELEASLDYRPIWKYRKAVDALPVRVSDAEGRDIPFQVIETEHHSLVDVPWRRRVLINAELPAWGWNVIEMAYDEAAKPVAIQTQVAAADNQITNGEFQVRATIGATGIHIERNGQPIFDPPGLHAITVEDPWGSWGGMSEQPESLKLTTVRHRWTISDVHVLERGPLRAAMWVQLKGGDSRLELTFFCVQGRRCVDVSARLLWNERSARLKLVLPCGDRAVFQVPGAVIERQPGLGEVPGGRWVRIAGPRRSVGLASDGLYNFDAGDGVFRATVCRASRYADDVYTPADAQPWRAAVDAGELKFKFLICDGDDPALPLLAEELEQPPVALPVPPHPGKLPRRGSLGLLEPSSLRVMALKPAEDGRGLILRVQETAGKHTIAKLRLMDESVRLTKLSPYQIMTWRLIRQAGRFKATATDAIER
ncbi:glycoside hydrolase family 38 C-terminal domain-containing protein [Fontivita pretiosa]|uniref:glycoside hydrolase family 38 N-terminal domain-containing protein n=1 Tax=Fontivita pretiosa TaxID=2989684 RepID=UPI003D179FE0